MLKSYTNFVMQMRDSLVSLAVCLWVSNSQAQTVTVEPAELSGPMTNPLMGFRPDLNGYKKNPDYPTVVRDYIRWNQIEPNIDATADHIRSFCDNRWKDLPAANVKVIPRIYIDWDDQTGNENWPSDLTTGDWTSPQFKARVVRLIQRLGEVWDNDPRVAWVQTGIIGYWGEQENPVGVDEHGWGQLLSDTFTQSFKKKKMIVRNMDDWPSPKFGVYWDSYGHPGQRSGAWRNIQNFNNNLGRYKTEIVEGEVAYNWGIQGAFADLYGGFYNPTKDEWESNPNINLGIAQYTDNMIDVIKELHCSALGWIASYDHTNATIRENAARVQAAFGYRFHINEFSTNARVEPGANLNFQFKVKNTGSAPFYENWPVAVVLVDEETRQIVWKSTLPNVDIRSWQPGHDYSYTSKTYQTPAITHTISSSLPLPANLPAKSYLVGVTILEPLSRTPGVFFAVPNFFKESQTQPLCRIGVGTNVATHQLTGTLFDDLVKDEKRSYTITQQGSSHSLTLTPSQLGDIAQPDSTGIYLKDTGVEVKAIGKLGYGFSSWGGALAGSTQNPATVVMDSNKSISANYTPTSTHRLTTSYSNGSILLDPPGGIYNLGTEVTMTAIASSGYTLRTWSGDISSSNPTVKIIMNGDKTVNANFSLINEVIPPEVKSVLLLVNNASALNLSDAAIKQRLETQGKRVSVISAANSTSADAEGQNLILVSSTVSSSAVGTKFRDVPVPVINWETALQDEFLFSSSQSTVDAQSSLNIVNTNHPLAAGINHGNLNIMRTGSSSNFSSGKPMGNPIIIARLVTPIPNDNPSIYAYEIGAAMSSGVAPARRIHFFFQNDTFSNLNADGVKLFDAAVSWATEPTNHVITRGPNSIDFTNWANAHSIALGAHDDDDKDGVSNFHEYLFGHNPKNGTKPNLIHHIPSPSSGTITYTRRKTSLSGFTYSIWYSTHLTANSWIKDSTAIEQLATVSGDVETVNVDLTPSLLSNTTLFVRVQAD